MLLGFDLGVIARNWDFLILQGFLGVGKFVGGTVRLAIPAIIFGFILGVFIGLGRLSSRRWVSIPATMRCLRPHRSDSCCRAVTSSTDMPSATFS